MKWFHNLFNKTQKIIVILGQTATGKTNLSISLAKKNNGEIISADSRQVYTGLDLGSGKVTTTEMQGIPHYMIDVVSPTDNYTVVDFQEGAQKALHTIVQNNHIPIICGGTGMYIDSLIYNQEFPKISKNKELRAELEKLSLQELTERLVAHNTSLAESIDMKNPRRIIRALEIAESGVQRKPLSKTSPYKVLFIGLKMDTNKELHERIYKRILSRIDEGMIDEVTSLLDSGKLTYEKAQSLGLEYRYISQYIRGNISYDEMIEILFKEIKKFAKRQMTWFRRNKNIHWFHPNQEQEIIHLVEKFLK